MIGTLLGNRYELLDKIGEGGMADVYKARCHLLNRFVAVKVLKEEFIEDKEFVDKFKREATAVASLSDNNIVNIYDVGSQGDINYIVMEYVKGITLKELIQQKGVIEPTQAIDISIQIAKALDCAHKNNIIHRDVKPHNIMVTEDGLVKVTDFGIAKASNSVTLTNTGKVLGSAHYFSPEQAKGNVVDCRTDIYSFGIVMYEMVTGRVPYDAESPVSVALKHIQEKVIPPKQIKDSIPDSLNSLILKCIEKEPINRYQSTKELLVDLNGIKKNFDYEVITKKNNDNDYTIVMSPIKIDKNNKTDKTNEEEEDDEDNDDDDDDEEEEEEYNHNKVKKPLSKGKKAAIIASLFVLIIAVGVSSAYFFPKIFKTGNSKPITVSSDNVTVPNIVGLTESDAKKKLETLGLKYVQAGNSSNTDKPAGTITECNPTSGTSVKKGTEIRAIVSSGQKSAEIPDFTNQDINYAKQLIANDGYQEPEIKYEDSDSVSKNMVIKQSPEPGSNGDKNTKITLWVSNGSSIKYSTVPNVVGKDIDDAKQLLSDNKLNPGSIKYKPVINEKDDGKVLDQTIDAGTQVQQWSPVNLTVGKLRNDLPNP
ncbi:MAG: Stk1 family PASTA domain-containing Ser/Thr kinase [Bacillota bacterium]|nr:Stk1 family PASTA domain-containing Ser/Thr kinase [Bacillota bacterium]